MSNRSRLLSIASATAPLSVLQFHSPNSAAALTAHIMITPDQVEWGDCSAALPAGARCAVLEGDLKASGALFGYRLLHVYAMGPWGMTYVDPADDPRNRHAPR